MKTSLIISTYNWPEALAVCLDSVRKQSSLPDEIIIADDGSSEETSLLVKAYAESCPVPIKYVWQEDQGFRLAKIRNKAIAEASGDFIIQIDGDVFLHNNFIEDFVTIARPGSCILGSRVSLGEKLSFKILKSSVAKRIFPWTLGIHRKPVRALYLKLGRLISFKYRLDESKGFGCAMGFYRNDFIAVNGYDERFEGWGCEDRDLLLRLLNNNVHNHKLLFTGIVFHLWHKEASRINHLKNKELCYNANKGKIKAQIGISQYLKK